MAMVTVLVHYCLRPNLEEESLSFFLRMMIYRSFFANENQLKLQDCLRTQLSNLSRVFLAVSPNMFWDDLICSCLNDKSHDAQQPSFKQEITMLLLSFSPPTGFHFILRYILLLLFSWFKMSKCFFSNILLVGFWDRFSSHCLEGSSKYSSPVICLL